MNNLDLLAAALLQTYRSLERAVADAGRDPQRNAHVVRLGLLAEAAALVAEGRGDRARSIIEKTLEAE